MIVRLATRQDSESIREVHCSAFPENEGEIVARLATDLLLEQTSPQTVSLIAETDNVVVGHIAFSPVRIYNHEEFQGYILAPLGIKAECQKLGIGSKLIEYGMNQIGTGGVNVVFVYGDPRYYCRFGFSAAAALKYSTPYRLQYPSGWQGIILNEYVIEQATAKILCVTSLCDPRLW